MFQGAFWSMMAGFAVGLVRMGLEFGYKVPPCGSGRIVSFNFVILSMFLDFTSFKAVNIT